MSFNPEFSNEIRHSRMLLAGIQVEFGLDPRLKHSGVTVLEVASHQIFEGAHEDHEVPSFVLLRVAGRKEMGVLQEGAMKDNDRAI
jgi:hypothetical protein